MISIPIGIRFGFLNVNFILELFPHHETEIIRRGHLDEDWDFVIVPHEATNYNWSLGLRDERITAIRSASDSTVANKVIMELNNMHYGSMEDYYNRGGPATFRKFIENYNIKN